MECICGKYIYKIVQLKIGGIAEMLVEVMIGVKVVGKFDVRIIYIKIQSQKKIFELILIPKNSATLKLTQSALI